MTSAATVLINTSETSSSSGAPRANGLRECRRGDGLRLMNLLARPDCSGRRGDRDGLRDRARNPRRRERSGDRERDRLLARAPTGDRERDLERERELFFTTKRKILGPDGI